MAREYPSAFPWKLLKLLDDINSLLESRLLSLSSNPDFQALSEEEAEQHMIRYSLLYSYLFSASCFVQRADVDQTLIELVQPLKRLMKQGLADFDLVLHPLTVLNYSTYPIGRGLSEIARVFRFEGVLGGFPEQAATVGFPGLDTERYLTHCIIAHELGHCLYLERQLEGQLIDRVRPNEGQLEEVIRSLAAQAVTFGQAGRASAGAPRTLADYMTEIEIRSLVTATITNITRSWVKELAADCIAYCLFGPAYVFASLTFLTLKSSLDDGSLTHPPNRMRFKLLYQMLDSDRHFLTILDSKPKARDFLDVWRNAITIREPGTRDPIRGLAASAIVAIYADIVRVSTTSVRGIECYSSSTDISQIPKLCERIKSAVIPNETIENGQVHQANIQSILIAGWLTYLNDLETLQQEFSWEPWEAKIKLNGLVAKAIDLNEIQKRWGEVQA